VQLRALPMLAPPSSQRRRRPLKSDWSFRKGTLAHSIRHNRAGQQARCQRLQTLPGRPRWQPCAPRRSSSRQRQPLWGLQQRRQQQGMRSRSRSDLPSSAPARARGPHRSSRQPWQMEAMGHTSRKWSMATAAAAGASSSTSSSSMGRKTPRPSCSALMRGRKGACCRRLTALLCCEPASHVGSPVSCPCCASPSPSQPHPPSRNHLPAPLHPCLPAAATRVMRALEAAPCLLETFPPTGPPLSCLNSSAESLATRWMLGSSAPRWAAFRGCCCGVLAGCVWVAVGLVGWCIT
jgi:hypothetical protein